jgi:hypothetical protein
MEDISDPIKGKHRHKRAFVMALPPEHTALLQRGGFPIPATGDFSDPERDLLSRYGYWMEALASGQIAPFTPEQQHFVRVAQGAEEPNSAFEQAWTRYKQVAAPPQPKVGPLELAACIERLQGGRTAALAAQEEHAARRAAILEQVRPLLEAVDAEFADRLKVTAEELSRLQTEARDAVLTYGASFRHAGVHAVYSRGRVTWDTGELTRYMETHPEVAEFRRIGEPSVSLRFAKE